MSSPRYEVLHCQTPQDVQRCINIRIKVFVDEQRFTMEDEMDG